MLRRLLLTSRAAEDCVPQSILFWLIHHGSLMAYWIANHQLSFVFTKQTSQHLPKVGQCLTACMVMESNHFTRNKIVEYYVLGAARPFNLLECTRSFVEPIQCATLGRDDAQWKSRSFQNRRISDVASLRPVLLLRILVQVDISKSYLFRSPFPFLPPNIPRPG